MKNCPYCNAVPIAINGLHGTVQWDCGSARVIGNHLRQSWHCLKAQVRKLEREKADLQEKMRQQACNELVAYIEREQAKLERMKYELLSGEPS